MENLAADDAVGADDYGADDYGADVPSRAEVAEFMEKHRAWRARVEREKAVEPSLKQFFVWWDDIMPDLVDEFRRRLDAADDERAMQVFLEANPMILVQPLGGGHGRWVLPQKRLGAEHVTDFVVAEKSSIGFQWTAVELESPRARMFTKKGDFTTALTHAIRQIEDWRAWIGRNRDYAERPRDKSGLGLVDIDDNVPGWIILGRRGDAPPDTHDRRRSVSQQLRIEIHSYDWLLERAEARAKWASGVASRLRGKRARGDAESGSPRQ
jgi:hypothetical protein